MGFVTFIIILAILFVYADDKELVKKGLYISFWLIVVVFSLRYGYGNDFYTYQEGFRYITHYSSLYEAIQKTTNTEIGWIVLCYLCKPVGYQLLITISTFFLCNIYYYLINRYILKPYRWVGVLVFLMYPNLFLLDLSMIRQGLAGALFLLSFCKGLEDKWLRSAVFCLLAISVHQMALICIPFILMINLKKYLNPKVVISFVIAIFLLLLLNISLIDNIFSKVMTTELAYDSYSNYLTKYEGTGKLKFLSLIPRIVVIIPSLIWYKNLKETDKYFTIVFCIAPFTLLIATQNFLLLRLECFFLPFSVLIFPRLLSKDCAFGQRPKNWNVAKPAVVIASMGWFLFTVRSFFNFFSEPTYAEFYSDFHTIIQ